MPMYKGPAGFERFMNLFMNLVIAVVVSIYILSFVQGRNPQAPIFTPLAFLCSFLENLALGIAVVNYVPVTKWAQAVGARIANPAARLVVQALIYDVVMSLCISILACTISNIQTLGPVGTFMSWISVLPGTLALIFVVCLVCMPLFMKLSAKLSGFDPANIPAGGPGAGAPGAPGAGMPPQGGPRA